MYGQDFICDLGAGIYNAAYFGEKRYENPFCGAEGHNLIFIDGNSQGVGKEFKGQITEFKTAQDKDIIMLDLTRAYPSQLTSKVRRQLTFLKNRVDGELILEDEVKANRKLTIESRLHIRGKFQIIDSRKVILEGNYGNVCIRVEEPPSAHIEIRELNSFKSYQNLIDSPIHHWIERTRYYVSVLSNNVNEMKFVIRILPFREMKELSGL